MVEFIGRNGRIGSLGDPFDQADMGAILGFGFHKPAHDGVAKIPGIGMLDELKSHRNNLVRATYQIESDTRNKNPRGESRGGGEFMERESRARR